LLVIAPEPCCTRRFELRQHEDRKRHAIGDRFGKPAIRLSILEERPIDPAPAPPQIPAHRAARCGAASSQASVAGPGAVGYWTAEPPTVEGDSERSSRTQRLRERNERDWVETQLCGRTRTRRNEFEVAGMKRVDPAGSRCESGASPSL
jgi:hypothetical protein